MTSDTTEESNPAFEDLEGAIEKVLDQHAALLGRIAVAWNRIHIALGSIYVRIAHPNNWGIGWAVWHAPGNDRASRRMLGAACGAHTDLPNAFRSRMRFVLSAAQEMENSRDTALHAPYEFNFIFSPASINLRPAVDTGHGRAKNLDGVDMAELFAAAEHDMIEIRYFCVQLANRISGPMNNDSWPQKPALLRLTPAKSRAELLKRTSQK
jgi:hypothetical protein